MSDSWDLFLEYAAFARAKPTFDLEEREQPLSLAATMRSALKLLRRGEPWLPAVMATLASGRRPGFVYPAQAQWFEAWAEGGDGALEAALAGLSDQQPAASFRSFADAATEAWESNRVAPDPAAVLALGSLFNFVADPHSLPIIQPDHFRPLESMLGHKPPDGSIAAEYESHLEFAEVVRERLAGTGIPVRDMLDVQALIRNGSTHVHFWAPGRGAPIEEDWDSGRPYLSICATYRDEAPYLQEWIEFHRLVGVERFYLYNKLSSDDHQQVLAPYVESGVVVGHDWPTVGGQIDAYAHCVETRRDETRWLAFIDLDEFLFSPAGRPLPEVLADYESFPGVGVNTATFGPSGHRTKPPGLVTESYVRRLHLTTTIKSIVNPRHVARCNSVHSLWYDRRSAVDENKYPIQGAWTKSPSCDRLRINHYFTKSMEEYRRRSARPNALGQKRNLITRLVDPDFTPRDEYDDAILRYVPALQEAVSGQEVPGSRDP